MATRFKMHAVAFLSVTAAALMASGCSEQISAMKSISQSKTFHQKFNLRPDQFFSDPQLIELCAAIEENDLVEIQRLIDAGADVNARGRDNVTPLLWAYPDNKTERFKLLLAAGADPNVKLTGNLGIPSAFTTGESVTLKSAKSFFLDHFHLVMQHGGDPNITDRYGNPILHKTISSGAGNVRKRVQTLIERGADVNALDSAGWPATIRAISAFQQYDIALLLLDLGCDHKILQANTQSKLIHAVVSRESRLRYCPPEVQANHQRLLQRLIDLGEDADAARRDNAHWSNPLGAEPPLVDPFKRSWER